MTGRHRSTGARWRRRLLIGAVQLVIVLAVAEVVVRAAAPHHRGLRMVLLASTMTTEFNDAETLPELMNRTMLGFRPGAVHYGFVLNSRSFRTHEYAETPAPGVLRVVALGDSFTFASGGLPHEDHWTTRLEGKLLRRLHRPVEVIRLGVPDTGPAFQSRLWQVEASALEPELVVVAFFVGNDFVDHQDDVGVFGSPESGLSTRLASASVLYRAIRNLARVVGAGVGRGGGSGSEPAGGVAPGDPVPGYRGSFEPDRPTFSRRRFLAIEAERMALCLRSEQAPFELLAERVAGVVVELAATVEATGARCLVMVIPDQYQVDPDLAREAALAAGRRLDDYDLGRPQRFLLGALDAAGVDALDMLSVFRRHADPGSFYRPRDTHWSRTGNAVAAEALARRVTRRLDPTDETIHADGFESGSAAAWVSGDRPRDQSLVPDT